MNFDMQLASVIAGWVAVVAVLSYIAYSMDKRTIERRREIEEEKESELYAGGLTNPERDQRTKKSKIKLYIMRALLYQLTFMLSVFALLSVTFLFAAADWLGPLWLVGISLFILLAPLANVYIAILAKNVDKCGICWFLSAMIFPPITFLFAYFYLRPHVKKEIKRLSVLASYGSE